MLRALLEEGDGDAYDDGADVSGAQADPNVPSPALDLLVRSLVHGGLVVRAEYFKYEVAIVCSRLFANGHFCPPHNRKRIDDVSPALAWLWVTSATELPLAKRASLLPPLRVLTGVLTHYASMPASFCALCALVPLYDLSLEEAHRDDLSAALRDIMRNTADDIPEASRAAAQVRHIARRCSASLI